MSSMLSSQGLVLATAMAVSSTLVCLVFSRQKTLPPAQLSNQSPNQIPLRSCLCSGDKNRERKKRECILLKILRRGSQLGMERRKNLSVESRANSKQAAETKFDEGFRRIESLCTKEFSRTACKGWHALIECSGNFWRSSFLG